MTEWEDIDLTDRFTLGRASHSKLLLRVIQYLRSRTAPRMPATPVLRPTRDEKAMLEVPAWHLEG